MTTTTSQTETLTALLEIFLPGRTYELNTYTALEEGLRMFQGVLQKESTPVFVSEQAEILAARPGADAADRLAVALKEYPEDVVKMISRILQAQPWPATQSGIFITGNSLLHALEMIVKAFDLKLKNARVRGSWGNDRDEHNKSTIMGETLRAINEIRSIDGYKHANFMEYIDDYERFQISVLESEGGICRD